MKDKIIEVYEKLSPEKKAIIDDIISATIIGDDFFLLPVVDGPPGTGKTHTATIVGSLYVRQNPKENKVLYLAFTNYALDRIKEELDRYFPPEQVIRLTPNPMEKDWSKGRIGCDPWLASLSKEDVRRIRKSPFLICTPFMLGRLRRIGGEWRKMLIIIDEFSQIDVATFFMILGMLKDFIPKGIILFGDPLQLPVVTTQEDLHPNIVNFLGFLNDIDPYKLKVQFRMHDNICQAINKIRHELASFNPRISTGHPLISDESVKSRTLIDLGYTWHPKEARRYGSNFDQILDPSNPLVFIDTSDLGYDIQSQSGSWYNKGEMELIIKLAKAAKKSLGKMPKIITPYTAQSRLLKLKLNSEDVLTVYKAQGREYPFVIVSMVRNNPRGDIGFLDQPYLRGQGYVALSRAMSKLIVLMANDTFISHPIFETLIRMEEEKCLKMQIRK